MKGKHNFLVRYSLYNILIFWAFLLVFVYLVNPGFYSIENISEIDDIISIADKSESYQQTDHIGKLAFEYYERSAALISEGLTYLSKFPQALLSGVEESDFIVNAYVLTMPFLLSFLLFLFVLNAVVPEKLLIASIINSSIITFTIFMTLSSNDLSKDADIAFSPIQMVSYAFLNSLIFIVLYVVTMSLLEKASKRR